MFNSLLLDLSMHSVQGWSMDEQLVKGHVGSMLDLEGRDGRSVSTAIGL